ncbi:MAG: hypothetical protein WC517_02360 [Patescibacteria group bacterium]
MKKLVIFVILAAAIVLTAKLAITYAEPQVSMDLAVSQMQSNSTQAQAAMRTYNTLQPLLYGAPILALLALTLLFYGRDLVKLARKLRKEIGAKSGLLLLLMAIFPTLAGCGVVKPFNTPLYFDANTNQTVFLVPLDGDFKTQGKLDSVQAYEDRKVSLKRIQITKRWYQDGYLPNNGHWIADVALFVCDRAPVARHWTSSGNTGTSQKNQGFSLQSKDGVRFIVDYDCTANILDAEAAKFMYFYPTLEEFKNAQNQTIESVYTTSLAPVMDTEIWMMVQIASSEFASGKKMEELKSSKAEMNAYVRDKVTSVFKDRGVNISSLGISGDFSYINDTVQVAINEIFTSQRQLDVEQAKLDSMANQIAKAANEGKGEASQQEQAAIGKAASIINEATGQVATIENTAKGQADAIRALAKACREADNNPAFIPVRQLQIEAARIKKWGGQPPQVFLGSGSSTNLLNLGSIVEQALLKQDPTPAAPEPDPAPVPVQQ